MQFEYATKSEFQRVLNEAVFLFQETFNSYYQSSEEGSLQYLLIKKLLNHCQSISVILDGTSFEAIENSTQVDHASAKVLLRSTIEIYATLTSLFWFEGKDILNEREFRFLVYKYSGFKSRQKLNHDGINSNELREKIKSEKNKIKIIKKLIQKKGSELGKKKEHLNKILDNGWGAKSISQRLEDTSLPKFIKLQYSYLCGY